MSEEVEANHADEAAATVKRRDSSTQMDAHTTLSDDDHGHGDEALGPIDWGAWAVAVVSGAAALLVVLLFWIATIPDATAV